jgi:hypothetical protein
MINNRFNVVYHLLYECKIKNYTNEKRINRTREKLQQMVGTIY